MKNYKAIIYDIDGTLLDTLKMNMIPLQRIIKEELNKEWSYEEVLKFVAYPGMKTMEELNISNKEEVYARWVKYVNEYEEGASLYENMDIVLKSFEGKFRQAIVSSKMKKQYEIDCVSKGLDKYMEVVVLADDTKNHKPHPEPINKCIELLGISKDEAIYIGDTFYDYQASKNAEIDFGYAKWGSVSDKGIIDSEYTFETPLDLLNLLNL